MPVDTTPPTRVAGPILPFRKFSFVVGATTTVLVIVLVNQIIALML